MVKNQAAIVAKRSVELEDCAVCQERGSSSLLGKLAPPYIYVTNVFLVYPVLIIVTYVHIGET